MKKSKSAKIFLTRKNLVFALIIAAILMSGFYFIFFRNQNGSIRWKNSGSVANKDEEKKVASPYHSFLDGSAVSSTEEECPQVVGAMVDNSPDVPSQAGINQAPIVYEAMAEGGVTRYLAIFNGNQEVVEVGPIRSARRYFLDWIQEYGDAMYMHVGGSPEALSFLKQSDIFDVNEFGWGKYFWRSNERAAPHNILTSSAKWQTILEKTKDDHPEKKWEGWKFGDIANETTDAGSILLPYFSNYKIQWTYNASSSLYERFVNNSADRDSNKNQIITNNIVVQMSGTKVLDEVGRRKIETVGSGDALVLRNGKIITGSWTKETMVSRTKFFDKKGEEIVLSPGKTFVQVLPDENFTQIKY
jgi:hypothetical protein